MKIDEVLNQAIYTAAAVVADNERMNAELQAEAKAEGMAKDLETIKRYGLTASDLLLYHGEVYAKFDKVKQTAGDILKDVDPTPLSNSDPTPAIRLSELRERQEYKDNPYIAPETLGFMSGEEKTREKVKRSTAVITPTAKGRRVSKVQRQHTDAVRNATKGKKFPSFDDIIVIEALRDTPVKVETDKTEDDILQSIQKVVDSIDLPFIKSITHSICQETGENEADFLNYNYCYKYLISSTAYFFALLNAMGGDMGKAYKIIRRKAKELFPIMEVTNKARPETFVMPVDKFSNKLASDFLQDGADTELNIGTKKRPKTLTITLNMPDDEVEISGTRRITETDKTIENAIISIMQAAEPDINNGKISVVFTPEMINRVLSGDGDARITNDKYNEIRNSIYKMKFTPIKVNFKDAAEKMGKQAVIINSSYLNVRWLDVVEMNGNITSGYELLEVPPRYQVAESLGHIQRYPTSINDTPLSKSIENVTLTNYLLERITEINRSTISSSIKFEDIYSRLGIVLQNSDDKAEVESIKKRKKNIRKNIIALLEFYKTGQKPRDKRLITEPIIKDYRIKGLGKSQFYSIEIERISSKNPEK